MFRIDECRGSAELLGFGDRVQSECCLTARFRSEDLDDAAAWKSAHAQSGIDGDGAGRDRLECRRTIDGAEAHDGTFAELFFNLRQSQIQSPCFFVSLFCHSVFLISFGSLGTVVTSDETQFFANQSIEL